MNASIETPLLEGKTTIKKFFDRMIVKTIILTMFVSFIGSSLLFYLHTQEQEKTLQFEIENRSRAVGRSIINVFQLALKLGIPFENMVAVKDFLDVNLKNTGELDYITITDLQGELLYKTTNFKNSIKGSFKRFARDSYPDINILPSYYVSEYHNIPLRIEKNKKTIGYLHLGVSQKITAAHINDVYYDIMTILFVSMVIGFEFLIFIFRNSVMLPLFDFSLMLRRSSQFDYRRMVPEKTKDAVGQLIRSINRIIQHLVEKHNLLSSEIKELQQGSKKNNRFLLVNEGIYDLETRCQFPEKKASFDREQPVVENLRLPSFLVVLAETVLVTILPAFAMQFYTPDLIISKALLGSTPIVTFMVFSGLSVPLATFISYRIGFQKTLVAGAIIAAFGYILNFFSVNLYLFLLGRAITAIGYGLSYVTYQNYIAAYASNTKRIKSYSIFAIAFAAAYICGAPIGGILVDNIGYYYTFAIAGIVSIFSMMIVRQYIVDFGEYSLQKTRETLKKPRALFSLKPLLFPVFCSGLPARLIFTSIICMFYPLYLTVEMGNTQSTTGRVIMIFGVTSFLISPLAARFIEKIQLPQIMVSGSSFLIAFAILFDAFVPSLLGPIIGLFLYAAGAVTHTLAMMSLLEKISEKEYNNHTKSSILSMYFIVERIGMTCGPALVGLLLTYFSFYETMLMLGLIIVIPNTVYLIYWVYVHLAYSKNKELS